MAYGPESGVLGALTELSRPIYEKLAAFVAVTMRPDVERKSPEIIMLNGALTSTDALDTGPLPVRGAPVFWLTTDH